jgi:hypothetical protein
MSEFLIRPPALLGLPPGWFETVHSNPSRSDTYRRVSCFWWDGDKLCYSNDKQGYLEGAVYESHGIEFEFHEFRPLLPVGKSVLQPWVMRLSLREQGTLLTAVRGCDLTPKLPLDSVERRLVSAIRGHFMVPADEREVDVEPGAFMSHSIPKFKWSQLGHYPQHWVSHVLHAIEVLAFRHPVLTVRHQWHELYAAGCRSLHVNLESLTQFEARMCEDRIANNSVVS